MNLGSGDFLVVHEGLQNNPDIKRRLEVLRRKLTGRINSSAHLSDIALSIDFIANDLKTISKELFALHKTEQAMSIKDLPQL